MGFCTSRNLLLTICTLQLIALFERQVFEFLGFLWIPILVNFFEIIFVIFGFFGAYQYRPKYIASRKSRKNEKRMSLYSIEFSPQHERPGDSDSNEYDAENHPHAISPKPMTPRRVKRRSVMQRGTTSRHSTSSRRHIHTNPRSSTRSSRRSVQNPVTRLMEQQQKIQQQQQKQYDIPASSMDVNYHDYHVNVASTNNLMAPSHLQLQGGAGWQAKGHSNPTYQQSSSQSLNEHDDFDDLYNNRPPSARSSYSNFHGTRTINYGQPQPHGGYPNHATPQVPQKTLTHPNRQSLRSKAFLNNGPPAYSPHGHGHLPLDSETTI